MVKKISVFLITLCIFIITSCSNMLNNNGPKTDLLFTLGENNTRTIYEAVRGIETVSNESKIKITCDVLAGDSGKIITTFEKSNIILKNLSNTKFDIKNIPLGNNYKLSLGVFLNNNLIYSAISDFFSITEENSNVEIQLSLVQENSSIKYELNGGTKSKEFVYPSEYFITSDVNLPAPEKKNYKFDGWYLKEDFSDAKITILGKSNFHGNVTLYAKWIKLDTVANVAFSKEGTEIDFGEEIALSCTDKDSVIYYTIDGTEPTEKSLVYSVPLTVENNLIQPGDKIIIKAFAEKQGMGDSGISTKEYTLKRYTVTFDTGYHGAPPAEVKNLKKNDKLTTAQLALDDSVLNRGARFENWIDQNSNIVNENTLITGNLTLTAQWHDFSPLPPTDLAAEILENSVKLTWTRPTDEDIKSFLITCDEDPDFSKEVNVVPGEKQETTVSGFVMGNGAYNFNICAVDYNSDTSANKSSKEKVSFNLPVINDFTIPGVGPNSIGKVNGNIFTVIVTGSDLQGRTFTSSGTGGVKVTNEVVSGGINLTIDCTGLSLGEYDITLETFGDKKVSKLIIRDNYEVGDVVYANSTTPVAVIFKAGAVGSALGVGLKDGKTPDGSFLKGPTTHSTKTIETLRCSSSLAGGGGGALSTVITGDDDGSDNWPAVLKLFQEDPNNAGKTPEEIKQIALTECPGFKVSEDYGTNAGLTSTSFGTGWFVPNLRELCELYKVLDNPALNLNGILKSLSTQGGEELIRQGGQFYWTSSTSLNEAYPDNNDAGWIIYLSNGQINSNVKVNTGDNTHIRCIRKF